MKTCGKCKAVKPLSAFVMDHQRGRQKSYCLSCTSAAAKEWRKRNPNYERQRYQSDKTGTRERHLIRKYKVTLADYERMLKQQNGRCAICQATEESQHKGVFHVDHCHATGRVRGLLCRGCNHILGHVKDDPQKLRAAIDYLGVVPQIPEIIGRAIMRAECDDYDGDDDFAKSYSECLRAIRERKANGGKGWTPP
jgi:Autographiviridae endonuclease VII